MTENKLRVLEFWPLHWKEKLLFTAMKKEINISSFRTKMRLILDMLSGS